MSAPPEPSGLLPTLEAALDEALLTLRPHTGRDWSVPAGPVTWTCLATAAHVAHDLLAYAAQVAGRSGDRYLPLDLSVRAAATPADVLDVVAACGGLLAAAVRTAPAETRGWHWGPTDPDGFAALGANELLAHTHDVTTGLGLPWRPPARLAAPVLRRLFPDAPPGDPSAVFLWCTGRADLPGRRRPESWVTRAARPR